MITIINEKECYQLVVEITDIPSVTSKHLSIKTKWMAAKNNEELRSAFSITLSPEELTKLGNALIVGAS